MVASLSGAPVFDGCHLGQKRAQKVVLTSLVDRRTLCTDMHTWPALAYPPTAMAAADASMSASSITITGRLDELE